MRIDLMAPPYSGHLHPVLAMARELAQTHDVRVISTPAAQARIAACGLAGVSVLDASDDALLQAIANPGRAVRANPWRMHAQLRDALALMARFRHALLALYATDRPALVIADFTLASAGPAVQACGIAWWTSMPSPCVIETPDGPPAYLGGLSPARHGWDTTRHAVGRHATRLFKRAVFALHAGAIRAMGLSAPYRTDGSEAVYSPDCILALGMRALEFERQWPAAVRFVGPYLRTPPYDGPEPPFMPGKRHVLVTAGTHLDWFKNRLAQAVAKAAAELPDVMFHISDGHAEHCDVRTVGNVVRLPYVDYARHLTRYDLVVHHGGAGVMYGCLAEGVRALVHPLDFDQFDHAARLREAGAAWWLRDLADLPAMLRAALAAGADAFPGLPALQQATRQTMQAREVSRLVEKFAAGRAAPDLSNPRPMHASPPPAGDTFPIPSASPPSQPRWQSTTHPASHGDLMKLYFAPGTCSQASHIALRELALPAELVRVNLRTKRTAEGGDFLEINPKGYVAALVLDDGKVLTEAAAILQYIADQKPEGGLAPRAGTWERSKLQEWLGFVGGELHGSASPLFNPALGDDAKTIFRDRLSKRLDIAEAALKDSDYLQGEQFSVADAYLFVVLSWFPRIGLDVARWPALAAFQALVAQRPAVQEAIAAEAASAEV